MKLTTKVTTTHTHGSADAPECVDPSCPDHAYDRLSEVVDLLEPDALRVVLEVARRLARARGVYGDLNLATDTRNFAREKGEELLDALAYDAMRTLQEADRADAS